MTQLAQRFWIRASDYRYPGSRARIDLLAGVSVAIVAMPLALAFGITAGLGAQAGLITAIVAGIVAGVMGGSDVQVSGPTGAMTVVLLPIVARYGRSAVVVIGVIAGALLVVAAISGIGRYVSHIPWPVVEGFTVGIGVIIFLQQVPSALGVPKPDGENAAAVAIRAVAHLDRAQTGALLITFVSAACMVLLPRINRALPSSLIAVAAGTVIAALTTFPVEQIGTIPAALPTVTLPDLGAIDLRALIGPALAVAALAAIESLLSARVAEGMSDGRRHDPDRELLGQGLANIASCALGGMPATGAIARTAVNVRAGARTRLATITHGVILAGAVLTLGSALRIIPIAALAGVLMVTAARMIDVSTVRALLRSTRSDAIVLTLTAAATIVFDLIVAIEVGIVVASALALRAVARTTTFETQRFTSDEVDATQEGQLLHEHIVAYRLDGALFFGAAQRFLAKLGAVADVRVVILRLGALQLLDATGAQTIGEIVTDLEARGTTVLICGAKPGHRRLLTEVGALEPLAHDEHVVDTLDAAIAHARIHALRTHEHASPAS